MLDLKRAFVHIVVQCQIANTCVQVLDASLYGEIYIVSSLHVICSLVERLLCCIETSVYVQFEYYVCTLLLYYIVHVVQSYVVSLQIVL